MAHEVLTNCKLWVDAYDLSGDMSALALTYQVDAIDGSVFDGSGTRQMLAGLARMQAQHVGLWEAGAGQPDDVIVPAMGSSLVVTLGPRGGGAEGEPAYACPSLVARYRPLKDRVGSAQEFEVELEGGSNARLVRGTIAANRTVTATGTGPALNLGSVPAGDAVYAALHVLAASGTTPSITVVVESDTSSAFSAPVSRITFAAASAPGAQWGTPAAGSISHTWWRMRWTVSGTTPSFTIVGMIGII